MNHRQKLFGHVFSGRYKALLVEGSGSGYLKTACDYAHLNPVRAGMFPGPERLLSYPNLLFVRPLALSVARVKHDKLTNPFRFHLPRRTL